MKKTYFDIAKNDFSWVPYLMERADAISEYNQVIIQLQQVAEKYMKGYINMYLNVGGKYDSELRSHNLRLLVSILNSECNTDLSKRDAKFLGDYYYDARYPGDNYELVTDKQTADECLSICEDIIEAIEDLLKEKETLDSSFFGQLED